MGFTDCLREECRAEEEAAYNPLSKELRCLRMWLEAAKMPAALYHVKPWEICHQSEYRVPRNLADVGKFGASESDRVSSDEMRDFSELREPGGTAERLNLERDSGASEIPEFVLVRNALYALQGVESAVKNLENISNTFSSQPADRTSHSISSFWCRTSSTNALGKLLYIIAHAGQIYCQIGKFVAYFSGKRSNIDETVESLTINKGDEVKGKRNRKHPKSKGNKSKCCMTEEEIVPEGALASSAPFSLVNQAFAIALRCILQGYLAALNTLPASVAHRRSKKHDRKPQLTSVSSSEAGCLTSVVSQEITLLELYLHTGELRTHVQALGAICMLPGYRSVSEAVPVENDLVNKAFQEFPRGADLLTYLYIQLQEADPIHRPLLKFLFARACRPYFDFIKSWLYRAAVKDPYKEFIVEASENMESNSCIGKGYANHFPASSIRVMLKVRDGVSVPCFLKHVSTPLLRAGQQLQVLTRLFHTAMFGKKISHFLSNCMPSAALTQLSSLEAILGSWAYFSNENALHEPVLVYSKRKLEGLIQKREKANRQMLERLDKIFVGLSNICRQKGFMVAPVSHGSQYFHGPEDYQGNSQKVNDQTEKGDAMSATRTLDTLCKEEHQENSSKFLEDDFQGGFGTTSEAIDTDVSESSSDEDSWSDNILTDCTAVSGHKLTETIFGDQLQEIPRERLDVKKMGRSGDGNSQSSLIRKSKDDKVVIKDSNCNDKVGSEMFLHCGMGCRNWVPVPSSGIKLSTDATENRKLDSLISDYQRGTNWPQSGLPRNPFLVALACENKSNDYLLPDFSDSDNAWDIAFGSALGPVQRCHQVSETSLMKKTSLQSSKVESKPFTMKSYSDHECSDFSIVDGNYFLEHQSSCSYMAFHPLLTRNAWGHLQYLIPERSLSERQANSLPYYDFSSVTENPETFAKNMASEDVGVDHSFLAEHHEYMENRHSNNIRMINHENRRTNLTDDCKPSSESGILKETQPSGEIFCELDHNNMIYRRKLADTDNNYLMSDCYKEDSLSKVFGGAKWETSLGYSKNEESLETGEFEEDSEIASEIPLDVVIDKCIVQEIMLQYQCISDFTVKLLEEGFGFQKHLLALRRYFFMEVADWADGFVTSLCQHKWSPAGSHQRLLEVQAMLESALQRSSCEGDEYDDQLYIYIKDAGGMPHSENSLHVLPISTGASYFINTNSINAFDFIGLGFKVDWPLNIILKPDALNMYSSIFSFLIQIKLTVFSLNDIWNCLREFAHCVNRSCKLPQDKEEMEQFRLLMQLRQQVSHFVAALQQYVQSQLLHVVWHKFLHILRNQVLEVKATFARNLKQLYERYIKFSEQSEISLSYFWMFLDYNEFISSTISKNV
ncbi:uncharacterized protein LOC131067952 isoform X4 [Cryptomeria japonica]|uniref:uncharacterized protein LOC131067952 isoform X4 n=1 Tax=Cryptomeria japonica TaxID=3369 RepID=UPI0027DAAF20|nr:uncharacterized protein LOC131067952 isoform X4 [Cryptomeria japonica]